MGIALISMTVLFPCSTPYTAMETVPVSVAEESVSDSEEEIVNLSEAKWETTVYGESAPADTDTGEGENTGIDIRYLLFLQEFRRSINDAWTPFMEFVSTFATRYLILAVMFIYWAVNKRSGLYTIAAMCLTLGINQLVKLTACVYRPWIRDPRIVPAGDAITSATGYSFPSGHTATAAPLFGGMAVTSDKKHRWFPVLCVLGTLLIAFSRNYLGVHTPQDVFVAICESVLCLIIMSRLFAYIENNPENEDRFLLAGILLGFISIAYITFKPYPMTYVDGKLLVDPQKMMNDGYGDICLLIAFPVARYIEKTWVRFRSAGLNSIGILTGVVGLIPMFFMIVYMRHALDGMLGSHWGHFSFSFIIVLYSVAVYPLVIRMMTERREKAAGN